MNAIIELKEIKRDFRIGNETVHALRGVSFAIEAGEFVTIMGTSGSGKSTSHVKTKPRTIKCTQISVTQR